MSVDPKEPRSSVWRELGHGELLRDATGDEYRILRFLAEGGYSQVYEAERAIDPEGAPHFAVKVLNFKHAKNKKTLRRQMREAEALYELNHPNVVRVHSIGVRTDTGMVFMVMDLLVGRTLRELVRDLGGRMPIPWTLHIMIAVCRGLAAIHTMAVHRDLKPENIHTRDDGHISLFDLGTSRFQKEDRLTTQGYTIGTLNYMSPEQLSGAETLDGRSDLFAVGTMLYELLSGENPFADKEGKRDRQEIGNRIMFRQHTPLNLLRKQGPDGALIATNVPEYLVAVVERLLRKKPDARYASAAMVADLLSAALAKFTLDNTKYPAASIALIGTVPRTPEPDEGAEGALGPSVSTSTSTNPFMSVSFPPDEAPRKPPAEALAYASTEQIACYALPALAAGEAGATELVAEGDRAWSLHTVAKLDRAPVVEDSGPERIYLDPDALLNTTLTPHAASFQDVAGQTTVQVRAHRAGRAPRVLPIFFVGVIAAAVALAGLFGLRTFGVIGPARAARPSAAASAPAPTVAPPAPLDPGPSPSATSGAIAAALPAETARPAPSARPAPPRASQAPHAPTAPARPSKPAPTDIF
jgi:serine/threonine protein kinase